MLKTSSDARRARALTQPPSPSSQTLAEAIRIGLADEITSGLLRPGAEVDEQAVGERFGASRTPVREALRQLAATGLVTIEPRRGVRVAALTADLLGEMFEVMAETEALCVRLATYRMTGTERAAFQMLHDRSRAAMEDGDVHRYDGHNNAFHQALYAGTHNTFLANHAAGLRLRLAPFRRAQFRSKSRLRLSYDEHAGLLHQMLRGDGDEAGRLMRAHMLSASAALAEYMSEVAADPAGAVLPS